MPEIPRSRGFVLKMASDAMHCSKQISAHQHDAVEDTTQAEQAAQLMGRLSCCCNGPRTLFGGIFRLRESGSPAKLKEAGCDLCSGGHSG